VYFDTIISQPSNVLLSALLRNKTHLVLLPVPAASILRLLKVMKSAPFKSITSVDEVVLIVSPLPLIVIVLVALAPEAGSNDTDSLYGPDDATTLTVTAPLTPFDFRAEARSVNDLKFVPLVAAAELMVYVPLS
jgi:hypothetical protein